MEIGVKKPENNDGLKESNSIFRRSIDKALDVIAFYLIKSCSIRSILLII